MDCITIPGKRPADKLIVRNLNIESNSYMIMLIWGQ